MDLHIFDADQDLQAAVNGMDFTSHFNGPDDPTTLVVERVDLMSDVMYSNLMRVTEEHQTDLVRSVGFGEDGPRFSHENGNYVDNYPWLD